MTLEKFIQQASGVLQGFKDYWRDNQEEAEFQELDWPDQMEESKWWEEFITYIREERDDGVKERLYEVSGTPKTLAATIVEKNRLIRLVEEMLELVDGSKVQYLKAAGKAKLRGEFDEYLAQGEKAEALVKLHQHLEQMASPVLEKAKKR